jgi:hypothetical protein
MTDAVLKALLIIVFAIIFFQDIKDRLVYWFLYPIAGIVGFSIHAENVGYKLALLYSMINLSLVAVILLVLFLYSKLKLKMRFANGSMGMGDILLFIFLSFTFPTIAFIILFVFSLFFAIVMHYMLKDRSRHANVPLAGYIALFFAVIYMASFVVAPKYLFS